MKNKFTVLNLAHRGFSGKYPENTRRAFLAAVEEGNCDGFESDVHLSKDGEPVIIHDDELDRTSDGKGLVEHHTFAELRKLDFGSWKGREFAGERIMHLDELLDLTLKHGKVLNLEIKNYDVFYKGIEKKVIGRIQAAGAADRVFLSSFNHPSMMICKKTDPKLPAGILYGQPLIDAEEYASGHGLDALHPGKNCLRYNPDLAEKAHKRGLKIHIWTVNTEEDMLFCLDKKVDSIITNFPDRLSGILSK
ncbi:MAG: glycerophosphodiester phosphodiesterase [Treponema sp.]|nr:glycerophosphodiester phosphodiesterase [Treponema sp.]